MWNGTMKRTEIVGHEVDNFPLLSLKKGNHKIHLSKLENLYIKKSVPLRYNLLPPF